jgi:hypothetical protein
MTARVLHRSLAVAALCAGVTVFAIRSNDAAPIPKESPAYAPNSSMKGHSYAEWQAIWWQWILAIPVDISPFNPAAPFDVTTGQTGNVWFLSAVFGTNERTCTIPKGKNLFLPIANGEWSDLEGFPTEADQRAQANAATDMVVVDSLFCTVDDVPVEDLGTFRHETAQFTFEAPTPWIFGAVGGTGHAVDDGYYVMLKKLSPGTHTLHYGATFDFGGGNTAFIDMTYHLTQE